MESWCTRCEGGFDGKRGRKIVVFRCHKASSLCSSLGIISRDGRYRLADEANAAARQDRLIAEDRAIRVTTDQKSAIVSRQSDAYSGYPGSGGCVYSSEPRVRP
jgi:hypothetical protein